MFLCVFICAVHIVTWSKSLYIFVGFINMFMLKYCTRGEAGCFYLYEGQVSINSDVTIDIMMHKLLSVLKERLFKIHTEMFPRYYIHSDVLSRFKSPTMSYKYMGVS